MHRPTRRIATVAAALALVLVLSALVGFFAPTADALPANEIWILYYNDTSHSVQVGERYISCSGHGNYFWGTQTPYYDRFTWPCW